MDATVPTTFTALATVALALLPGAAFMFAYEAKVGPFGVSLPDRVIRFLAASAVLHALAIGLTYHLYSTQIRTGRLAKGLVSPVLLEWLALSYVLLPYVLGFILGTAKKKDWRIVRWLAPGTPEPRAWDFVFSQRPDGIWLLRLKSGVWVAGIFGNAADGRRSYAAGYKEEGDLYLVESVRVDQETGEVETDSDGFPISEPPAILVRWNEIEYAQQWTVGS